MSYIIIIIITVIIVIMWMHFISNTLSLCCILYRPTLRTSGSFLSSKKECFGFSWCIGATLIPALIYRCPISALGAVK